MDTDTYVSVSYTHLDVYKRQSFMFQTSMQLINDKSERINYRVLFTCLFVLSHNVPY